MKKMIKVGHLPLLFFLLLTSHLNAQSQLDTLQQKRLKPMLVSGSVAYVAALAGLNELWYSDFERESFHFFNDHNEWNQLDKGGHFFSAFQLSKTGYNAFKWAGQTEKKSILWGSLLSVVVLTPIEIFDGFSSAYGASYSDLIANTAGAFLFYIQQKQWGTIKIHPKYSFRRTDYPNLRPKLLGENLSEEILKDYNGQTQWLSFDLSKIIKSDFPKWLNVAIGYGAQNMVAASNKQSSELGYKPYRQYYLALDFDLNEYKTKSKLLNTIFYFINMIHLPAPTIEYGEKLKFHIFYH